jgi:hypothetical protein
MGPILVLNPGDHHSYNEWVNNPPVGPTSATGYSKMILLLDYAASGTAI